MFVEPSPAAMSDEEEAVLKNLRRVIRAVDLYSRRLVSETGLSGPQLICMRQLAADGPVPSGQLAAVVNLSPATVTGILDRLEARGLVSRRRETSDKRRVAVELTDAGHRAVSAAPPVLHESFLFRFRSLPPAERSALGRALKKLVSMMAADDLDAAPILVSGDAVTPGPGKAG